MWLFIVSWYDIYCVIGETKRETAILAIIFFYYACAMQTSRVDTNKKQIVNIRK